MNFKLSAIAAAVAAATLSAGAGAAAVDFHGYARSGVGSSVDGGSMVCYWGPSGLGHFRLGNECDTYFELAFDANLAEKGETKFNIHTMIAGGTQQLNDWEESTPSWRQMWAEATNVGSGPLATANIWAGKRYYKRQDIHMTDFFYNAVTGPGAGLENVDVGFGKLSYAYMRTGDMDWSGAGGFKPNYADGGAKSVTTHDLRLEGVQLGGFGSLDFIADIVSPNSRENSDGKKNESASGYALTAQHTIGVLGGFNRAVIQIAQDGANLDGTAKWWSSDTYESEGWRFLDHLVFDAGAWNGSATFGYQVTNENKGKDTTGWNLGGRVWYHFNDLYSVGGEVGHDSAKTDGQEERSMNKLTLAGQISAGKSFWARPAIRAYYTYANWNDAMKNSGYHGCTGRDCGVGVENGKDFASNGSTYGVQFEAWW
ncbi:MULTISPECIES: maltoporin [Niveibacterium]|uniref:Carbohydrate porin n=1 Tax=Niveibacterium microcysteis TaxID=2811415 RepID=A0ABX7MAM2_9RHOO|nr:carbohydrate porin [Niveibacterium microcysteis]QSI78795.1 carbohydrate porin [Niveibacterium microcysteis]